MSDLKSKKCTACEGGISPLSPDGADELLAQLEGWVRDGREIVKTFAFANYYETMAFVNAAAFIAHREDHHPVLEVSYKTCRAVYTTHAVGGLSENDFICAAKLDALVQDE